MSEFPKGWAVTTIEGCCDVIAGQSPPGSTYNDRGVGIPFFQGKTDFGDIYPTARKWCTEPTKLAERGDVLVSVRAPVGPTNMASETCCIGRGIAAIRSTAAVIPKFVLYQMRATEPALASVATGSTFSAVSSSQLKQHIFRVAPVREQGEIVGELEKQFTRLDAATAALKRVQANLKRYRASVLKAACGGLLVPTEADVARKEGRDYEPAQKLLERILRERRARWESETLAKMTASGKPPKDDSWKQKYKEPSPPNTPDLPSLPEGWCWASVDQVGMVQLGRQRSPEHHDGDHMTPYLRVANVFEDRVDTSDVNWMNFTPAERVTFGLREGDILLNEGQSLELIGRPAMYRNEIPGCCFQNTLVRFRPSESLDGTYALALFLAYFHSRRFQKIAKWTTNIAHLGALRFASLEFPLPPISEQHRIAVACEEVSSRAQHLRTALARELDYASTLRRALLAGAFSGSLLPQDPNDEPASVLLERLSSERASTVARKPIERRNKESTYA